MPTVPRAVVDGLARAAEALDALGDVNWFWQHGDFCLNNLIVAPQSVGIIDFDEFGATSVPLQDEIGLGVSVAQLSAGEDGIAAVAKHISSCVQSTLARHPALSPFVRELLLHYLVWRVNRAYAVPQRQAARAKLLATLLAVAESPASFLDSQSDLEI